VNSPETEKIKMLPAGIKRAKRAFEDTHITSEQLSEGTRFDGGSPVAVAAHYFDQENPQDVDWGGIWQGVRRSSISPDLLLQSLTYDRIQAGDFDPEIADYLLEQKRLTGSKPASET
jgi:hypothetical protein